MPAGRGTKPAPPPLWPYLLACAAAAAWIDLGRLHRYENADTLIPVLASLYRWTPFFWEQDRYGLLVPLLALPCQSPLANLLLQEGLAVFAALAAMFLLARHVLRTAAYPVAGAVAAVAFLTLAPAWHRFVFLVDTCYGVALALGLGALVLAEPGPRGTASGRHRLAALALMLLAHWVYGAVALVLGPVVLFRGLLARRARSEVGFGLLLLAAGTAFGAFLSRRTHVPHTALRTLAPGYWPEGWRLMAGNLWAALTPPTWPIVLGLAALAGAALMAIALVPKLLFGNPGLRNSVSARQAPVARETEFPRHDVPKQEFGNERRASHPDTFKTCRHNLSAGFMLLAAALPGFLFMGTQEHVRANDYEVRYAVPSVFVAQVGLAVLAAGPVAGLFGRRGRRWLPAAVVPALLLAAWRGYGVPSPASVRADLDAALGGRTADVLAAGCTHVTGDYWSVWSTVYHANLLLHERGEDRIVWGVAERSGPTRRRWARVPAERLRVAVPPAVGPAAAYWLVRGGFPPLAVAERRPTVWVMTQTK